MVVIEVWFLLMIAYLLRPIIRYGDVISEPLMALDILYMCNNIFNLIKILNTQNNGKNIIEIPYYVLNCILPF